MLLSLWVLLSGSCGLCICFFTTDKVLFSGSSIIPAPLFLPCLTWLDQTQYHSADCDTYSKIFFFKTLKIMINRLIAETFEMLIRLATNWQAHFTAMCVQIQLLKLLWMYSFHKCRILQILQGTEEFVNGGFDTLVRLTVPWNVRIASRWREETSGPLAAFPKRPQDKWEDHSHPAGLSCRHWIWGLQGSMQQITHTSPQPAAQLCWECITAHTAQGWHWASPAWTAASTSCEAAWLTQQELVSTGGALSSP